MYTIAIDLGGTVVKIGLLSDGEIVDCVRLPSRLALGLAPNLPKIKEAIDRLLSRSVEDSATVCSVLIPWNSCGMTQATVLGVSTFVYAPYCIFNIVSPLMSLLVAAVGWNIKRKK